MPLRSILEEISEVRELIDIMLKGDDGIFLRQLTDLIFIMESGRITGKLFTKHKRRKDNIPGIGIIHTSARTEKWNSSKTRKESLLC